MFGKIAYGNDEQINIIYEVHSLHQFSFKRILQGKVCNIIIDYIPWETT